ncbi:MAG: hypothetical protein PUC11_05665 [Elusimicrobia bacterium]|nr:hypothetical protein [Elusimicrobiota bacterium]
MNTFLLETIITFNLKRPFLSLGKQPFYLIQELLNKPEFEEKHFSVVMQSVEPFCVLQNTNGQGTITVGCSNNKIFIKLSYMDSPVMSLQFDNVLSYIDELLKSLSNFLTLKWGIEGVSVFGNFMLLDSSKEIHPSQIIADGVMKDEYLRNSRRLELRYDLQRKVENWDVEDFVRIFRAKFDGYVAGKMNPDNIGIQREIFLKVSPDQYNESRLSEILEIVKPYFTETSIKGLVHVE